MASRPSRLLAALAVLSHSPLATTAVRAAPEGVADLSDDDPFYYQQRHLGTWFYCSKPKPKDKTDAPPPAPSATARLDQVIAELRELKAKAFLDPTEDNIGSYIRFQRAQLDRSSLFADMWQRAVWQHPDLDYTLQRPVSTLGKRERIDTRKADRDATIAALGSRHEIFYFFAQTCAA